MKTFLNKILPSYLKLKSPLLCPILCSNYQIVSCFFIKETPHIVVEMTCDQLGHAEATHACYLSGHGACS